MNKTEILHKYMDLLAIIHSQGTVVHCSCLLTSGENSLVGFIIHI